MYFTGLSRSSTYLVEQYFNAIPPPGSHERGSWLAGLASKSTNYATSPARGLCNLAYYAWRRRQPREIVFGYFEIAVKTPGGSGTGY